MKHLLQKQRKNTHGFWRSFNPKKKHNNSFSKKKIKVSFQGFNPNIQKIIQPFSWIHPTPFLNTGRKPTPHLDPPSQKTPTELKELSPFDILGFSPLENMPSAGEFFFRIFFFRGGWGESLKNTSNLSSEFLGILGFGLKIPRLRLCYCCWGGFFVKYPPGN